MVAIRVIPNAATRAASLLRTIQFAHPPGCPCHSNPGSGGHLHWQPPRNNSNHNHSSPPQHPHKAQPQRHYAQHVPSSAGSPDTHRTMATTTAATAATAASETEADYAFEMAASAIRFGPGATHEIGMDAANLGARQVCVVTDATVGRLPAVQHVLAALSAQNVPFLVYDGVQVEPKDTSVREAIAFVKRHNNSEGGSEIDLYIAVGGGSTMDTAKLMNLYGSAYPEADFLDFVNAPLGKGLAVREPERLKKLIAVPTTAGTGSETTGTAIFDMEGCKAKTGVASRALKPTLGICDPLNTATMPASVKAASGLDVLCHALESWTAIPFHERTPRPSNPILRPAYQGANPISDIFSLSALRSVTTHLLPSIADPSNQGAQSAMLLASTLAGVGFGNAGVHLCHGMSYAISGLNPRSYVHPSYPSAHPLIPHGVSVAVTAPAVFRFTAPSNPDRHLRAAADGFGVDVSRVRREDAGLVLADAIAAFLDRLGDQPKGLAQLGFGEEHVGALVEGTVPQARVLRLAPGLRGGLEGEREVLGGLFRDALGG